MPILETIESDPDAGADGPTTARLAELEAAICERDQLVTALTVQLEEAAERIDRMQRMGTDRGSRPTAGLPREFLEEQRALGENLQRLADQWEAVPVAAMLGRIEMQVSELRDLVAGNLPQNLAGTGAAGDFAAPHAPKETPAGTSWEAMKASLLGDPIPTPPPTVPQNSADESETFETVIPSQDVEPPPTIDPANATKDQLREAIELRDSYICWLIRRIRAAEAARCASQSSGDGEQTPEAIRERIRQLDQLFEEQQRLSEVELSIERARLGREEARLRLLDESLQKEIKRLGLNLSQHEQDRNENETPKNRRWRRILGIVRDEGDG